METVNLTSLATPSTPRREVPPTAAPVDQVSQAGVINQASDDTKAAHAENAHSAVERFQSLVQDLQRNLDFSVDDSSGQVVVKVMDGESGKLIRQIPSEDLLRLSERLEDMRSLLFKAEA
ncbi:flagellar protein FlaG [Pseudomonas stutzeri]|uniref:flagellar protein FlaG n=1 Tax=Stutzerimonas stutzeri TaxID=316 RepID=UPI000C9C2749|nr:flagellar protein FlaG [Stutzerimonas stutzeri]MCQ4277973.1 flagellar protein FlaG [Stutzerimonas stutzeri]PNF74297.1 flagellin [Stutzerimonas stutzeri]